MITFLFAAGALGVGLWLLLVGLLPPKLTLAQQMARVPAVSRKRFPIAVGARCDQRAFGWAGTQLARVGLPGARVRDDLALLEKPVEALLAQKAMTAVVGMALPAASFTVLATVGIGVPVVLPMAVGLVSACVLFFVPDLVVRSEAVEYRRAARLALRLFLDQAVITLAGGAGIEQALIAAARDGRGPVFRSIRSALNDAQVHREPAWPHLDRLGQALGVRELSELAATCALAGAEGAKVKASISAKAHSIREREFAERIAEAESATERLTVPGGVLGMSFVCFLIFAALAAALRPM